MNTALELCTVNKDCFTLTTDVYGGAKEAISTFYVIVDNGLNTSGSFTPESVFALVREFL